MASQSPVSDFQDCVQVGIEDILSSTMATLQKLKAFIPVPIKLAMKQAINYVRLGACIRELKSTVTPSNGLLQKTNHAWGNESWSGDPAYLKAVCDAAAKAQMPILECGSGITTILLAIYAGSRGIKVVSLEHHQSWQEKVSKSLRRFGLPGTVLHARLISYGDFDWYEVPEELTSGFGLVVCDGPPASTRGGRVGLLPVCKDRLDDSCVVLLDDAERAEEQAVLSTWKNSGVDVNVIESATGSYASVRMRDSTLTQS